jgi:hypothetical protein
MSSMKSPLINFSFFYFVGGATAIALYGIFIDPAAAKFLLAGWIVVGVGLVLVTYGIRNRAGSDVAGFVYLLGIAWLVLLFLMGVAVIWNGGIGVKELQWLMD